MPMLSCLVPPKLKGGDAVRIVAPSKSMGVVSHDNRMRACKVLEALGLEVTFGRHVDELDIMGSSCIQSRVEDLHEAFADPHIKGILTVLGGYNANQLLPYLDWGLIKAHPKIFCGFSDITVLSHAIYHKTGLVTYSGPHFSSFAMEKGFEYTLDFFKKTLFCESDINLNPSQQWSQDAWYLDQDNRIFLPNMGYDTVQEGRAQGIILGGNLGTLQLLRGTPYMPCLDGAILFLEDLANAGPASLYEFDRMLTSLAQDPTFGGVRGLVLGRFESAFGMTPEKLAYMVASNPALKDMPVVANADFGHTTPFFTFPIGGMCVLKAFEKQVSLTLLA